MSVLPKQDFSRVSAADEADENPVQPVRASRAAAREADEKMPRMEPRGDGRGDGGGMDFQGGGPPPADIQAVPQNHPFFAQRFNRGFRGFVLNQPFLWYGRNWCWVWWVNQWMLAPCPTPRPYAFPFRRRWGWPGWGGWGSWPNQSFSEYQWGAAPYYGSIGF